MRRGRTRPIRPSAIFKIAGRKHHPDQLARLELQPLPESLEEAFEAVENLDARHPMSRGQAFGEIWRQSFAKSGISR
jgi:glutamine synthetase